MAKLAGSILRIVLSLAAFTILIGLAWRLGPANIASLFHEIGFNFFVVIALFGSEEILRTLALVQCLQSDSRPSFRNLVHIRFASEAVRSLTLAGPFASEPTRAWLIRRHGVSSSEAVAATIAEYAANSFMSALLTIAAVAYMFNYVQTPKALRIAATVLLYGSAGYLTIAGVVLYWRNLRTGTTASTSTRVTTGPRRAEGKLARLRRVEDQLLSVVRQPRTVVKLTALEFVSHVFLLLETYWALTSMGLAPSFVTASLAEILTKLANVGFAGMTEGAYALLFQSLGLPAAAGFTLSLVKRLRSLAFSMLGLGILAIVPGSLKQSNDTDARKSGSA